MIVVEQAFQVAVDGSGEPIRLYFRGPGGVFRAAENLNVSEIRRLAAALIEAADVHEGKSPHGDAVFFK